MSTASDNIMYLLCDACLKLFVYIVPFSVHHIPVIMVCAESAAASAVFRGHFYIVCTYLHVVCSCDVIHWLVVLFHTFVPLYLLIEFFPVTVFYFIVMFFHINIQ